MKEKTAEDSAVFSLVKRCSKFAERRAVRYDAVVFFVGRCGRSTTNETVFLNKILKESKKKVFEEFLRGLFSKSPLKAGLGGSPII